MADNRADVIDKYVKSIEWIREELLPMDEFANPLLGIREWDDAVCVSFGGKKIVASVDGPYTKRLVMKSALIHAATDVVVKGAKPLFALDTLIGPKKELEEVVESLKKQALAMRIPLLGGNTLFEDVEPRCSLTVVGELLLSEPIRDSTAQAGDIILLLGEPIWGGQELRIEAAKKLFSTWYAILASGIAVNAAKDVTKGGLAAVVYEMEEKSGLKFKLIDDLPYPMARNLDNFILTLRQEECNKLTELCKRKDCSLQKVGVVE
jgi:selenophosphate synthetase-related protein